MIYLHFDNQNNFLTQAKTSTLEQISTLSMYVHPFNIRNQISLTIEKESGMFPSHRNPNF